MKSRYRHLYIIIGVIILLNPSYAQISNGIVNNFQTDYFVNNEKLTKKVKLSITILNRDGENLTHFYIPYSGNNRLVSVNAWIEDTNGYKIRSLNKKEIETHSAVADFSLYEDDFIKYFVLRHNEYPYTIKCEYELLYTDFLFIANWNAVYRKDFPTSKASLSLTVPKDYQINIKEKGVDKKEVTESNSSITYIWKSEYIEQYHKEPFSPPIEAIQPQVQIVPKIFNYGIKGMQNSWQEFGEWQQHLMDGLQTLPESEKIIISRIIKNHSDPYSKIEALYKFLQENTRYIYVGLGIGGLQPYSASYVAKTKYGDCKALTNYMLSILSYAGIESYYTIIHAGENISEIDTSFPCQQFNHVFLMTPLEQDTIWIECTSKNNPLGYLGTFTQNRNALVINGEKSHFIKTPKLTWADVQTSSSYNFEVTEVGESKVTCKTKAKGDDYETINSILREYNKKDQDDFFRYFLPIPQYTLNNWEIEEENKNSASITTIINASSSNLLKQYGSDYFLKVFPANIPKFTKPAERRHPVWIHYPLSNLDTVVYNLPQRLKVSKNSENQEFKTKFGEYSIKYIVEQNKITAIRKFILNPGKYNLEEYSEFYKFISEVKNADKKNVILLN